MLSFYECDTPSQQRKSAMSTKLTYAESNSSAIVWCCPFRETKTNSTKLDTKPNTDIELIGRRFYLVQNAYINKQSIAKWFWAGYSACCWFCYWNDNEIGLKIWIKQLYNFDGVQRMSVHRWLNLDTITYSAYEMQTNRKYTQYYIHIERNNLSFSSGLESLSGS